MSQSTSIPADRILERFIDEMTFDRKWSPSNVANATWVLNRVHAHLTDQGLSLTHKDPNELVDALRAYFRERRRSGGPKGTGITESSLRVEHRQLCAFYKWALKRQPDGRQLIKRNPMEHIERPVESTVDPKRKRVAAEWQYEALIDACWRKTRDGRYSLNGRRDASIIALLWHTGVRRSEICSMDVEQIDRSHPEGVRIFLPQTKNGSSRTMRSRWVTFPRDVWKLIDLYLDDRGKAPGPLFPSATGRRGRLTPQSVTLILKRRAQVAADKLGKRPEEVYTPAHSFRRSSAINWLKAGGDPTMLKRNHGWITDKMLDTYTDPELDDLTAAEVQRVAAARRVGRHLKAVSE